MTVLSGFNIIKEGDFYNYPISSPLEVRQAAIGELLGLYNGDNLSTAIELSGATISGSVLCVEAHWGESYDVGVIKYYHDEASTSGIVFSYGLTNGSENVISYSTVSGVSESSYIGDARFVRITHSISPGVNTFIQFLEINGVKNDDIGFGTSPVSDTDFLYLSNSPIGYESSTPEVVPVYNEYSSSIDIKLSVLPTGNTVDNYVKLSTTYSGEYYGINDYGYKVPASEILSMSNDSFTGYNNFSDFVENSDWDVIQGNMQSRIWTNSAGLNIKVAGGYFAGTYYGGSAAMSFGIVSKQSFTGNQSFTAKIKVRMGEYVNYFYGSPNIFFGFSNNMPIPCSSYNSEYPYVDETSMNRPGRSGAALIFTGENYTFAYNDGYLREYFSFLASAYYWRMVSVYTIAQIGSIIDGGSTFNKDWSDEAGFRELTFTWDHINRVATGYIDKFKLGEVHFSNPPMEGCRLLFTVYGDNHNTVDITIKDFVVDTENIYKQRKLNLTNSLSVTAYDSADLTYHGPEKAVDNTSTEWVGGYSVSVNDWLRFGIDSTKDVVSFSIKNPSNYGSPSTPFVTNISGSVTKIMKYMPKKIGLYDNDDISGMVVYDISKSFDTELIYRFKDFSGIPTVLSGVDSLNMFFIDFYDATSISSEMYSYVFDSLAIREVAITEEYNKPIELFPEVLDERFIPWNRGQCHRLRQYGSNGYWGVEEEDIYEIAVCDSSILIRGEDYDISNSYTGYSYSNAGFIFDYIYSTTARWDYYTPAYMWRSFKEFVYLKGVYLKWSALKFVLGYHGWINKFKVQYLMVGFSPNDEEGWADIPPIQVPYTGVSLDYASYRNYFINNNDGEYYTDLAALYASVFFILPDDTYLMKDFRYDYMTIGREIAPSLYLEFDESIYTKAVRIVILETLEEDMLSVSSHMNLLEFKVVAEKQTGSYTSPVFDTESELNTERVFCDVYNSTLSSGIVFVRSSSEAPVYKNEYNYLSWEPWQFIGYGTSYTSYSISSFYSWPNFGAVKDDKVYIMALTSDASSLCYDYSTNLWTELPPFSDIGDVAPLSSMTNRVVFLNDGALYVAVTGEGQQRVLKYGLEADEYGISGWVRLSINIPPEVVSGGMIGYEDSIYFFGLGGAVIKFNPSSSTWDASLSTMPLRGYTSRGQFWPVVKDGKVYIFGGQPYSVEIYDIESDSWANDYVTLPYLMSTYCRAFLIDDYIIVLSSSGIPCLYDTNTNSFLQTTAFLSKRKFVGHSCGFNPSLSWAHNGYVYAQSTVQITDENASITMARAKVRRADWSNGETPSLIDDVWGAGSSSVSSWEPIGVFGEVMPQNRYFQFKIQLDKEPDNMSGLIQSASVVVPQTIESVPSLGNSEFYVKLGISDEYNYEVWLSGANYYDYEGAYTITSPVDVGWNVIYGISSDGYSVNRTYPVLFASDNTGSWTGYMCPFVCKPTVDSYKMWVTKSRQIDGGYTVYDTTISGAIYYSESIDGENWDVPYEVVPLGSYGAYDSHSSKHCCVIENPVGTYKMWYTGKSLSGSINRILHCSSADGITWSGFGLSVDKATPGLSGQYDYNGSYSPWVIFEEENSLYVMWYVGIGYDSIHRIIRCTSVDGITWEAHRVVISTVFETEHDISGVTFPCVVLERSLYQMWYVGVDELGVSTVIYTTSNDGIIWLNPISCIPKGFSEYDKMGQGRVAVVSNTDFVISNTYFNGAKIKIYNG